MQARGLLMIEHRLIETLISIIKDQLTHAQSAGRIDPLFVDTAVDFIRIYADRTHHGKEEDILFEKLKNRPLSDDDKQIMEELINEHIFGRQTTKTLFEANTSYHNGDKNALSEIIEQLEILVGFYPKHIEKEDNLFFPAARKYFTDDEDQAMLASFRAFDSKMIHEKYKTVIEGLQKNK